MINASNLRYQYVTSNSTKIQTAYKVIKTGNVGIT